MAETTGIALSDDRARRAGGQGLSIPGQYRGEVSPVTIGNHLVGPGCPVYVIGEIGINHNGDLDIALQLMETAARAGCQAVKFQKRTPEICVPPDQRDKPRSTPWGVMTYLEYKHRMEFGRHDYQQIAKHAGNLGMQWFASPWDVPSVEFLEDLDVVTHKIASSSVTDRELLRAVAATGKPVLLSTGMSTLEEVDAAVEILGTGKLVILHATSTYPMPPEEANLRTIPLLQRRYGCRSATRATSAGCRSPSRRSPSAPPRSSGTSPWTGRCGAPTMRRPSSPAGWSTWSATSGSSRRPSATV